MAFRKRPGVDYSHMGGDRTLSRNHKASIGRHEARQNEPAVVPKPVTLSKLKFMEPKKIAGEII